MAKKFLFPEEKFRKMIHSRKLFTINRTNDWFVKPTRNNKQAFSIKKTKPDERKRVGTNRKMANQYATPRIDQQQTPIASNKIRAPPSER